jgi:hypothetical protein
MSPISICLWESAILHDELGLVKDWLTRLENLTACQVELVPLEEVATRENLIIHTNDLEDCLLFESKEVQLKESIKELEKHLTRMENEIRGRTRMDMNPRMRESTIIPGHVTRHEQLIADQISWNITLWHETRIQVGEETKSATEQIQKMAKQLKRMREIIDLT